MVAAMKAKVGNATRKLVLIKLADNANDDGECWPSYQTIANHCECSRSAVRKHIKDLESAGFLKINNRLSKGGEKKNQSNLYVLTIKEGDISSLQKTSAMPAESAAGEVVAVSPENTVEDASTVSPESTPVSPESTPPVSPGDTRTYHSFEPIIEPIKTNKKIRSIQSRFEEFYSAFPIKKSKGQALKAFMKLNPDDDLLARMISAIGAQAEHRDRMLFAGQFVPEWKYPSTWINAQCWDDEIPEPKREGAMFNRNPKPNYNHNDRAWAADINEGLI